MSTRNWSVTGSMASIASREASRQLSTAVFTPAFLQCARTSAANSHCSITSPPESVTPPHSPKNTRSRSSSSAASCAPMLRPCTDIAAAGQASTQRPHSVQRVLSTWMRSPSVSAPSGQAFTQPPHRTHVCGLCQSAGSGAMPSGFWHHGQRSGQPLRNSVLRSPAPS